MNKLKLPEMLADAVLHYGLKDTQSGKTVYTMPHVFELTDDGVFSVNLTETGKAKDEALRSALESAVHTNCIITKQVLIRIYLYQ